MMVLLIYEAHAHSRPIHLFLLFFRPTFHFCLAIGSNRSSRRRSR